MRAVKRGLLIGFAVLVSGVSAAQWGTPPEAWGDFQIGLNSRPGVASSSEMAAALAAGAKLDRRYVYANSPQEVFPDGSNAFLFCSWRNYARESGFYNKGVRPAITIYMLQNPNDGREAALAGAANQSYMQDYFRALLVMLDSCKGTQPIYVIEPDVWGYLLQNFESTLGEENLSAVCHINDLGFDFLSEFKNELRDLPKAIIKTIKTHDPDAYCGILMAHWGYSPSGFGDLWRATPEKISEAVNADTAYLHKLLGDTWRGDFIGVEKNGAAAGWYETAQGNTGFYWNDEQNGVWLDWAKKMAQGMNLPLLGWQISAGYTNEPGYDELPNTPNRYKETFMQYFFSHVNDFINAGFIGILLGSEDRGVGTVCSVTPGTYDNGYFYNKLASFNDARPYTLNLGSSGVAGGVHATFGNRISLCQSPGRVGVSGAAPGSSVSLYDLRGIAVSKSTASKTGDASFGVDGMASGAYVVRCGSFVQCVTVGR